MAAGDLTLFNEWQEDHANGVHDYDADTFKLALITSGVTPTASDDSPEWSATSGVDYDGSEVSGTNYTAGGEALTSVTWLPADTSTTNVRTFDAADVTWAQSGTGFTNARYAILYNDSATNKEAIGFVDLGSNVGNQTGPLTIIWNASGIFTITATAP